MMSLVGDSPSRYLFFTGKGGVGKTSIASAMAISLADRGRRVLLVSTDPASNLDEVLRVKLSSRPQAVEGAQGLWAMNIDPEVAAREYRERLIDPYRSVLPPSAVASIEEQLSGACTVEIAAFDEFVRLLAPAAPADFDHVIFDTAPTGHTLRLVALPAAWNGFLESSANGMSCLGPLSGLKAQRSSYAAARRTLADGGSTTFMLVTRPERVALIEAERTRVELEALDIRNVRLVVNGVFTARDSTDATALAFEACGNAALVEMPGALGRLPRADIPLVHFGLVGVDALRGLIGAPAEALVSGPAASSLALPDGLGALLPDLARNDRGVIMTMGKGGVGKTTVACAIALELARAGHHVHLTTTDPAAHLVDTLKGRSTGIDVSRIDPAAETRAYVAEIMETPGKGLDAAGLALLAEDLRSPCTEEIAVFRAFARTVQEGEDGFVVIDTAPTGHTLLLLDAAQAYHREVSRTAKGLPDYVSRLLPSLRDPERTRVLIVTLAEATPVHEAAALQQDLARAGVVPFAWVINQSLTPIAVSDPVLLARKRAERPFIDEVRGLCGRVVLVPWLSNLDDVHPARRMVREAVTAGYMGGAR